MTHITLSALESADLRTKLKALDSRLRMLEEDKGCDVGYATGLDVANRVEGDFELP